jgi:hypothetical protein
LLRRNYWWGQAGKTSKSVITQLDQYIAELPDNAEIWLINLPDQIENDYTFRNAFPAATQLLNYKQVVYAVLDSELESLPKRQREEYYSQLQDHPDVTLLWYKNGRLVSP